MEKITKLSMHHRFGRATLSHLAFPGERDPNFPWEKSKLDNTVVKEIKQTICLVKQRTVGMLLYVLWHVYLME